MQENFAVVFNFMSLPENLSHADEKQFLHHLRCFKKNYIPTESSPCPSLSDLIGDWGGHSPREQSFGTIFPFYPSLAQCRYLQHPYLFVVLLCRFLFLISCLGRGRRHTDFFRFHPETCGESNTGNGTVALVISLHLISIFHFDLSGFKHKAHPLGSAKNLVKKE